MTESDVDFVIREATVGDCAGIVDLIKALAEYEKLADQVEITPETLAKDGFGAHAYYQCVVAEVTESDDRKLVGYAMYYYTYSTFRGRTAYLEDLYVSPEYRSKGIGSAMLNRVAQIVVGRGCARLEFVVLNWNQSAIQYYQRLGAVDMTSEERWHLYRFDGKSLDEIAGSPQT